MKNFSNETKSKRRKAVLKVILKRYSFIIWLPLLLYIFYNVGKFTLITLKNYLPEENTVTTNNSIFDVIVFTFLGFMVSFMLSLFTILIIEVVYDDIIIPLTENTFFNNLINFFKAIGKLLLKVLLEIIPEILKGILKCPINLYKRIKDEKRRFQVAVEKQMQKEMDD